MFAPPVRGHDMKRGRVTRFAEFTEKGRGLLALDALVPRPTQDEEIGIAALARVHVKAAVVGRPLGTRAAIEKGVLGPPGPPILGRQHSSNDNGWPSSTTTPY